MHDGYYIGDSTTVVDVKFLLYNQDINIVTYVKVGSVPGRNKVCYV